MKIALYWGNCLNNPMFFLPKSNGLNPFSKLAGFKKRLLKETQNIKESR